MSVSSAQSRIASIQRDIQSSHRKLADLSRDEASKSGRIASVTKSITVSISRSSLDGKQREIQHLQDELVRIQDRKAIVSKDIATQTERLHRAQQELYREQEKEQKRSFEALVRRGQERDRLLLNRLRPNVMESPLLLEMEKTTHYDAFISYATEDKEELVRPLAELLQSTGHAIWYDEFQLRVGDSLRRSIDRGLASSKFGIVVLSPSFFAKNWTQYELDGLVAKEMTFGKVILPLWHKVSKNEVMGYSPALADKVALNTASYTIEELAKTLSEVLRGN